MLSFRCLDGRNTLEFIRDEWYVGSVLRIIANKKDRTRLEFLLSRGQVHILVGLLKEIDEGR